MSYASCLTFLSCIYPFFISFHIPIYLRMYRVCSTRYISSHLHSRILLSVPAGTAGKSPVQLFCGCLNSLLTLVFFNVIEQWDELFPELWNLFSQLLFSESSSTSSSPGSKAISRGTKASNQQSSISSPKSSQSALELPMVCASDLHLNDSALVHGAEIRNRRKKSNR